jgi:hypothetical protein
MEDQVEMFEKAKYHHYHFERRGKERLVWIVPYFEDAKLWAGAWYNNEKDAAKFAEYLKGKQWIDKSI